MWLKTVNVFIMLEFSVGQEFGSGSARCYWLRVSCEVTIQVSSGATVIGGLDGAEEQF